MTAPACVVCTRPTADGYACTTCGITKPGRWLAEIADMTPAARDVAHRTSRRSGGTGATGKPGSSLPLDLGATARLDAVQGHLGGWMRHVLETRGCLATHVGTDPIVHTAWYLTAQLEWFRHRAEVDEFLADVEECARIVRGLARGPAEQKYLGPCGAEWSTGTYEEPDRTLACEGDVYGPRGGSVGRCRTCGAEVAQADREAWLDGEVRSRAFRATQIADAYGVNIKTIRTWIARGHLVAHGFDGYDNQGRERPTFNVGEVLDLAAADKARLATDQAKRARRRQQAETEGDAA